VPLRPRIVDGVAHLHDREVACGYLDLDLIQDEETVELAFVLIVEGEVRSQGENFGREIRLQPGFRFSPRLEVQGLESRSPPQDDVSRGASDRPGLENLKRKLALRR
jgi:hypothetical protein